MKERKEKKNVSNRSFKASAFTAYFSVPENAAKLYQALTHSGTVGPSDIRFTTLEGVLYMARKNDMAFAVKEKVLVIGEHQATLNLNMPLRSAIYYGRTMERLIEPKDIYKVNRIPIPTPEFYVFYNGTREQPRERILKLSDAYLEKAEEPMLELIVKMININPAVKHPILEECRPIFEYSTFIQRIRDYMAEGFARDEAIRRGMEDCIKDGIMEDFIKAHGTEVRNMLFTEFSLEDALEVRGEERFEEGRMEGRREGRIEGRKEGRMEGRREGKKEGQPLGEIRIIRRKLERGLSVRETAGLLELDESYVARIDEFLRSIPGGTDAQIAERYLKHI